MKLRPDTVMLINLVFRILLILYSLKEEEQGKSKHLKPLKYWMDPISKRVFLIFLNGLQRDFLEQKSTPYLEEVVEKYGSFGVAKTSYFETNLQGFRTVLSGRYSPAFPFSLFPQCPENILDYTKIKCGMGNLPQDLNLMCYFPEKDPLQNFQKFPGLFSGKSYKTGLYLMSMDLDPVWLKDYGERLKKIDDDIRFLSELVDSIFADNKTTYIVTSARGSPVGNSLSVDVPVVAWGNAIAHNPEITFMWKTDLTAMLCALLGINFPSRLFGVIPSSMMLLDDYYNFELTHYTIRHFEKVLEAVNMANHLVDSSELELDQLHTRLNHVVLEVRKVRIQRILFKSCWLVVLLSLMGVNLIVFSACGFVNFFCHLKSLFLLLLALATTLRLSLEQPEFTVMAELILFWTWQNCGAVVESFAKNWLSILLGLVWTFAAVTFVGLIGNLVAIPVAFGPVILWPIFDGSYKRLNRFVLVTRLFSGIAVSSLPLTRVFGDTPDRFFVTCVSVLFFINFCALLFIFKRKIDAHFKINFFMIFVANFCVFLSPPYRFPWFQVVWPWVLLGYSLLSVLVSSGTPLSRLLKISQSLFIPVLLMGFKTEIIFYFSIVFHMFTWIFIEYHGSYSTDFHPAIFSVERKRSLRKIHFSREDTRQVVFFLIYCYVSYFAIGNYPDTHSYDLYVLPEFVYEYPKAVSYFLGGFKFFLPFCIATLSFITSCVLNEKDYSSLIMVSLWLADVIGTFLIFYSHFFNLIFDKIIFPVKFTFFVIQQLAAISVILSYFVGKHLLSRPEVLEKYIPL